MAIITGAGKKFMEELPLGIHVLSEGSPSDTIKLALYGPNAAISPELDAYTTAGEVVGGGYTAGGVTLATGLIIVGRLGSVRNGGSQFTFPYVQPVDDTTITVSNVGVRGCMLYNASQSNRNIFTLDFGTSVSPASGIIITWGVADVVNDKDTMIPIIGKEF
jgi:hypothetical protein